VGHGGGIETNHVPKLSPIAKISSIAGSISKRGSIASKQIVFQNPHQSQEAYQKEKGMERVSLEEHSLAITKTPTHHKKHIKKRKGWKE
jgi:hypothetical protein